MTAPQMGNGHCLLPPHLRKVRQLPQQPPLPRRQPKRWQRQQRRGHGLMKVQVLDLRCGMLSNSGEPCMEALPLPSDLHTCHSPNLPMVTAMPLAQRLVISATDIRIMLRRIMLIHIILMRLRIKLRRSTLIHIMFIPAILRRRVSLPIEALLVACQCLTRLMHELLQRWAVRHLSQETRRWLAILV